MMTKKFSEHAIFDALFYGSFIRQFGNMTRRFILEVDSYLRVFKLEVPILFGDNLRVLTFTCGTLNAF